MDSRAKQRLTGAIILATLFVLLVPELLTGPKPASSPVAPAEEEGLRSYTIDIDGKSPPAPPATNPAPTSPVGAPAASGAAPPPPEVATTPSNAAAPGAAPSEPGDATSESPRSAAPVANAPAPVPVAPPQAVPAQVPRGSFVVQLGSFGSRDNADRLVRDMSAKGFTAFVAPIKSGGRELYRVRVGPTRDRASAEALAAALKRVGQSGSIVPIS
jgi:DedD protein